MQSSHYSEFNPLAESQWIRDHKETDNVTIQFQLAVRQILETTLM
jgi:hypothetical protein